MTTYTLADVQADMLDNADFEESASVSKAKAFASAAKRWLIIAPGSASNQGSSMSLNVEQVNDLLSRALSFVAINDTSARSRTSLFSFENFRG